MRLFAIALLLGAVPTGFAQKQATHEPKFSTRAIVLDSWGKGSHADSPDGRKRVTTHMVPWKDDSHLVVKVDVQGRTMEADFGGLGLNPEVLWAPDSSGFAITASNGGAGGQYRTKVYRIRLRGLQALDPTAGIERAFGSPFRCWFPEGPNVVAVAWLRNGNLLAAAQVQDHTNCDSYGTFHAYAVRLPAVQIVRVYSQLESKRLFAEDLGPWLRPANDECARKPKACWVPANHIAASKKR